MLLTKFPATVVKEMSPSLAKLSYSSYISNLGSGGKYINILISNSLITTPQFNLTTSCISASENLLSPLMLSPSQKSENIIY